MPEEPARGDGANEELLRALCHETQALVSKVAGGLSRLSLRAGDYSVEIEWAPAESSGVVPAARPVAAGAEAGATAEPHAADHHAIVAPLVGTFYRSPEPGSKPFVEEGDVVEPGQPVAIVEAMKIMNRIEADRPGRVAKILVVDGDMVEFGQELLILEPFEG